MRVLLHMSHYSKCQKPRFLLWEEVVPQEAWDYEDKPSDVGLEVKALSG